MYALLTVVMENFDAVRAALQAAGRPPPGRIGAPVPVPEPLVAEMGGRLLVADLARGRVVGDRGLPTPAGLAWAEGGPLWVTSMWHDAILEVDPANAAIRARISHPAFNDLHTIEAVGDRLLVVSSGADAALELDMAGALRWSWWADPAGASVDHRGRRTATLDRALHLNSAIAMGDQIWASAFHTGEIRALRRDGTATVARDGLDHPHALTRAGPEGGLPPDTLLCCEAPRGQIRALNTSDFSDAFKMGPGLRWVQAACPSGRGTLLALDNPHFGAGRRALGPARVVELEPQTGKAETRLELPAGWRLFSILPLTARQRAALEWIDA